MNRLLFAAAIVFSLSVPANAATIYLTEDNSGGQLGGNLPIPGYGTVQVTAVGADLEMHVQMAPNWLVDTGVHHAIAFDLSIGGLPVSGTPLVLSPLAIPFVQAAGSSFVNPGFPGPLNYALDCNASGNGANSCNQVATLDFFVLGGAPALGSSIYFSADIISSITGNTGVVGGQSYPSAVPGPIAGAGLPGLALACGGLVLLARRRRRERFDIPD